MKTKLNRIAIRLFSYYFCFKYLPFREAIKLPIHVNHDIRIASLHKGDIVLTGSLSKRSIKLGLTKGEYGRDYSPMFININRGGHLYLGDNVVFYRGCNICITETGLIRIDGDFSSNANSFFYSDRNLCFGRGCMLGWNVDINTTYGHRLFVNDEEQPMAGDIIIDDHVWICAETAVCNNVRIGENCIVGRRSFAKKAIFPHNSLIVGNPAKVVKTNVNWQG